MSQEPQLEDSGESQPHLPRTHHNPHQVRNRFHELIHPHNGRKIHVAQSPEELSWRNQHRDSNQDDSFDIVLHGSPEHIEAIEALHAHHTSIQQDLQEKHADTFRLFEVVRDQIDTLDAELHKLTDQSVALDANFDRFGYSAHLRTISDTSSVGESITTQHHCRLAQPLRLFRTPRIRQYFHKGLIWRSSQASEVAAFELFIDLVYVGVIDIMGKMAVNNPVGLSLLHFVIAFSIAAKIWCDMTMVINWFDVDDVCQRIMFAFYLVCLFGYTVNVSYMFNNYENTYKTAVGFYLTQRLALGLWYASVAILVPMIRGTMFTNIITILVTSSLWITTMHISWAAQIPLMFLAILIDLFGNIILVTLARRSNFSRGRFMRYIAKWFDFYPAINIEHRVERNDSFVTLVFGYSVLTILYQSGSSIGVNAFLGKGILGLLQAFALHWIYFEVDAYGIDVHALRRHWAWATIWVAIHIPFVMSYVLAASTLSKIVLAHDSKDANPDWLAEEYAEDSASRLSSGLRWFYCGGLGVSLILMSVISLSHMHKKLPDARISKNARLGFRCCVAVIIICLAPAKKLDSLGLISITFGLSVLVLCVDLFGNTLQGHAFWKTDSGEKQKGSYTADVVMDRHKRAELRSILRKGYGVSIGDLWAKTHVNRPRGHRSESSDKRHDEEWHGGHY